MTPAQRTWSSLLVPCAKLSKLAESVSGRTLCYGAPPSPLG